MHYTSTNDERDLRQSLRNFLSTNVPGAEYEAIATSETGFDAGLWKRVAASGWLDVHAVGAMDPDISAWPVSGVQMAEEFGRTLVPLPVELLAGFLLPVLRRLPTGAFGFLNDDAAVSGRVPAVCVTPLLSLMFPGTGEVSVPTMVPDQDDGFRLTATFASVQFASAADWLFAPVRIGADWALARIALDAAGVTVRPERTIDPGRTGAQVALSAVHVPTKDVVTATADGQPLAGPLSEALLSYFLFLDGKAVGACDLVLERTLRYVKERAQFGVPVGSFQAVKHRLADMATMTESGRSLAAYTAWQVAQGKVDRVEAVLASRLYCADAYRKVCENAIQCHGGMGFTWEIGLHMWYRSAVHDAAVTGVSISDLARMLGRAA